jgi:hypothetical protein
VIKIKTRLTSNDPGFKGWTNSARGRFADTDGDKAKLVNSYSQGHAAFKVIDGLSFQSRLETRMRSVNDNFLEVTVVNTSSKTVTIQPQGYHNFLVPWVLQLQNSAISTLDPRSLFNQSKTTRLYQVFSSPTLLLVKWCISTTISASVT